MEQGDSTSTTRPRVADHLKELQKRFLVSAIALVLAGIAAYFVYEPILNLLRSPLDAPLYYSTPAGSFAFVMQICLMAALAVTIPIIIYNIIMFIRPAFEKALPLRRVYLTTVTSALLAFAGASFGFLVIVPGALHFFAGFQVEGLSALIAADSYLGFVTNVIITFVIMFQLPLVVLFIDTISPLSPERLFKAEKWVILGSLIVSFMVPFALDITTSLLIALPIIALYNLAIGLVLIRHAQRRAQQKRAEKAAIPAPLVLGSRTLEASFLLDEALDDLAKEMGPAQKAHPERSVPYRRVGSEIVRPARRPEPVTPAEWVHRVAQPIPVNQRARMISDITPRRFAN